MPSDEFDEQDYQPFPSYNPHKRIPLEKIRGNGDNLHEQQYDRYVPHKHARDPKCSVFTNLHDC